MTTANKITIFRLLLVPVFILLLVRFFRSGDDLYWLLALIAFALAALSDGVDGYLARHFNQKSKLGAVLDPVADKLLLISAIVLLSVNTNSRFAQLPLWLTGIIFGRDVILLVGLVAVRSACGKVVLRASLLGKLTTVFQMGVVLWILLRWSERVLPILIWGAAIATILSTVFYIYQGIHQFRTRLNGARAKTR